MTQASRPQEPQVCAHSSVYVDLGNRIVTLSFSFVEEAIGHTKYGPPDELHFTRKLYEIHLSLAEQLADMLDLWGVKSLLDLGGGSGVVSFALLRKYHDLTSTVVDLERVRHVGRKIAAENKLEKRITYLAADFLQDDLPAGFDMVMFCGVGSFTESLFGRIYDVLKEYARVSKANEFGLT